MQNQGQVKREEFEGVFKRMGCIHFSHMAHAASTEFAEQIREKIFEVSVCY